MEDRAGAWDVSCSSTRAPDFRIFGVFDGHGSPLVSAFLHRTLHLRLRRRLCAALAASHGRGPSPDLAYEASIRGAIQAAFAECDDSILRPARLNSSSDPSLQAQETRNSERADQPTPAGPGAHGSVETEPDGPAAEVLRAAAASVAWECGSTAVVAVLDYYHPHRLDGATDGGGGSSAGGASMGSADGDAASLWIASVGNSRAVLCTPSPPPPPPPVPLPSAAAAAAAASDGASTARSRSGSARAGGGGGGGGGAGGGGGGGGVSGMLAEDAAAVHEVAEESERRRVEAEGGRVEQPARPGGKPRLNGDLEVSRSFGDLQYRGSGLSAQPDVAGPWRLGPAGTGRGRGGAPGPLPGAQAGAEEAGAGGTGPSAGAGAGAAGGGAAGAVGRGGGQKGDGAVVAGSAVAGGVTAGVGVQGTLGPMQPLPLPLPLPLLLLVSDGAVERMSLQDLCDHAASQLEGAALPPLTPPPPPPIALGPTPTPASAPTDPATSPDGAAAPGPPPAAAAVPPAWLKEGLHACCDCAVPRHGVVHGSGPSSGQGAGGVGVEVDGGRGGARGVGGEEEAEEEGKVEEAEEEQVAEAAAKACEAEELSGPSHRRPRLRTPAAAALRLAQEAVHRGGMDNVAAVVVRLPASILSAPGSHGPTPLGAVAAASAAATSGSNAGSGASTIAASSPGGAVASASAVAAPSPGGDGGSSGSEIQLWPLQAAAAAAVAASHQQMPPSALAAAAGPSGRPLRRCRLKSAPTPMTAAAAAAMRPRQAGPSTTAAAAAAAGAAGARGGVVCRDGDCEGVCYDAVGACAGGGGGAGRWLWCRVAEAVAWAKGTAWGRTGWGASGQGAPVRPPALPTASGPGRGAVGSGDAAAGTASGGGSGGGGGGAIVLVCPHLRLPGGGAVRSSCDDSHGSAGGGGAASAASSAAFCQAPQDENYDDAAASAADACDEATYSAYDSTAGFETGTAPSYSYVLAERIASVPTLRRHRHVPIPGGADAQPWRLSDFAGAATFELPGHTGTAPAASAGWLLDKLHSHYTVYDSHMADVQLYDSTAAAVGSAGPGAGVAVLGGLTAGPGPVAECRAAQDCPWSHAADAGGGGGDASHALMAAAAAGGTWALLSEIAAVPLTLPLDAADAAASAAAATPVGELPSAPSAPAPPPPASSAVSDLESEPPLPPSGSETNRDEGLGPFGLPDLGPAWGGSAAADGGGWMSDLGGGGRRGRALLMHEDEHDEHGHADEHAYVHGHHGGGGGGDGPAVELMAAVRMASPAPAAAAAGGGGAAEAVVIGAPLQPPGRAVGIRAADGTLDLVAGGGGNAAATDDLNAAWAHVYRLQRRFGQGHFGEVWRAWRLDGGAAADADGAAARPPPGFVLKRLRGGGGEGVVLSGLREAYFGAFLRELRARAGASAHTVEREEALEGHEHLVEFLESFEAVADPDTPPTPQPSASAAPGPDENHHADEATADAPPPPPPGDAEASASDGSGAGSAPDLWLVFGDGGRSLHDLIYAPVGPTAAAEEADGADGEEGAEGGGEAGGEEDAGAQSGPWLQVLGPSPWWMAMRRHPGGHEWVRGVLRQLLTGLQVVHEANVTHRDVKPENMMLTPSPPPSAQRRRQQQRQRAAAAAAAAASDADAGAREHAGPGQAHAGAPAWQRLGEWARKAVGGAGGASDGASEHSHKPQHACAAPAGCADGDSGASGDGGGGGAGGGAGGVVAPAWLRLIDFGSAVDSYSLQHLYGTEGPSSDQLTLEYAPPEALFGRYWEGMRALHPRAWAYDMWSTGVVWLELVLGTPQVWQLPAATRALLEAKLALRARPDSERHLVFLLRGLMEWCIYPPQAPSTAGPPLRGRKSRLLMQWSCTQDALLALARSRDPLGVGLEGPMALRLLQRLLHWDPPSRPSARQALRHAYFTVPPSAWASHTCGVVPLGEAGWC
ncbi:hypothetical protein HYH03_011527 [Edaphochlamys debaryana]|uniref:protein-serine/threonine phosphatase n=1 Tax=Edaphochlamys debaryana TaxID=47281 RepID=A0A836BVI0_9CHLO|nr:hypothetical protein HYH03_011527 [Edaphochlamys debaryana]|eukprot:KAG2490062.1 hypothetical protein HYH03_011527 [Edaphochlamys debaryana]